MDDDQTTVLGHEVANFQHGHAVASRSDGHGELVLALVRVVEDGVAERVSDVLVRNLVLARGGEDLDPHWSKVTCRHGGRQVTLPRGRQGSPWLTTQQERPRIGESVCK